MWNKMIELRHSTLQNVLIGLFLGRQKNFYPNKPYSGLQLSWCWWKYLIKADGVVVNLGSHPWVEQPNCTGMYVLTLSSNDTNQKGVLTIYIHDESFLGIPVVQQFMVINQNVYDSKYGNKLLEITKAEKF